MIGEGKSASSQAASSSSNSSSGYNFSKNVDGSISLVGSKSGNTQILLFAGALVVCALFLIFKK